MSETSQDIKVVREQTGVNLTKVTDLLHALTNGFNITQACQYAKISRETYYDWLERVPGFKDQVEEAKDALGRKAKTVVAGALNADDVGTAKWYLERRDPDFKAKAEMDVNHGLQESRSKIKDFLDDTDDGAYAGGAQSPANADASSGEEVPQPAEPLS